MILFRPYLLFRFIIVAVIVTITAFLVPFLLLLFSDVKIMPLWADGVLGLKSAFFRTVLFALTSSLLNTVGALQLAIIIRKIRINDPIWGVLLLFLLFPTLMGNVTTSYVFKTALYDTSLFTYIMSSGDCVQMVSLLCIQFWQYGFLFTYLFLLCMQQIPSWKFVFGSSIGLTEKEVVRDIIIPSTKNLFILLFIIGLVFAFYESAKSQFVFKASQGMDTELVSQALYRIFQSYSIISPTSSQKQIIGVGLTITISVTVLISLCCIILNLFFSSIRKMHFYIVCKNEAIGKVVTLLCVAFVVLPILVALLKSNYVFSIDSATQLKTPLILTLISAFFASLLAILFGIAVRVVCNRSSSHFSTNSFFLFLFIFLLLLIPPICVVICAYKWMSIVGYNDIVVCLIWIWGHPILVFPLLGSFVFATHFFVTNNEIEWNIVHKLKCRDIILYSFIKRFTKDYILTFLFAFTFIWNDVSLNRVLSDEVPSFAERMQRLFVGRATDDAQATLYALIAILISFICLCLWKSIIQRIKYIN